MKSEFNLNFPNRTWTMITIELVPNSKDKTSNISLYINNEKIQSLKQNVLFDPNSDVTCLVNHVVEFKQNNNNDYMLLGLFFISEKLDFEEISKLHEVGQKNNLDCKGKIIFGYIPEFSDGHYKITPLHDKKIAEMYEPLKFGNKMLTFTDFLSYYQVSIILPIFRIARLNNKDGSKSEELSHLAVQILTQFINMEESIQYSSNTFESFFAISHILHEKGENNEQWYLTHSLYNEFLELFNKIKYNELKVQLLESILLEYNIWSCCPFNDQQLIFEKWLDLYQSNQDSFESIKSIEWFLYTITSNYKPNDNCKKQLFLLLEQYLGNNYTFNNILIVIQYILFSSTSTDCKNQLLSIFKNILTNPKVGTATIDNKEIPEILVYLLKVINKKNKDQKTISLVIQIFILLSDSLPNEDLLFLIQDIIDILFIRQECFFDERVFLDLIGFSFSKAKTQFLPLFIANTLFNKIGDGKDIIDILKEMDNKEIKCEITEQLLIYSALSLYIFYPNKQIFRPLCDTMIKTFKNQLDDYIDIIEILGFLAFDINTQENIIFSILNRFFEIPGFIQDKANMIFNITSNFILFRQQNSMSESSYYSDKKKLLIDIKKKIQNCENISFKYGKRTNDNNELIDIDLIKKSLDISNDHINNKYLILTNIYNETKGKKKVILPDISLPFSNKKINKDIISKYNKYLNGSLKTKYNIEELKNQLNTSHASFNRKLKEMKSTNLKIFSHLWKSLTTNRAPWVDIEPKNKKFILKRGEVYGYSFCPFKVKKSIVSDKNKLKVTNSKKGIDNIEEHSCKIISINNIKEGIYQLSDDFIILTISSVKRKSIPINSIFSALKSYKYHKYSGIQIFTKTGENYYLFNAKKIISYITRYEEIIPTSLQTTDPMIFIKNVNTTQSWLTGQISNFEYLMKLNIISGRSFKDVNQYPIFPWILSNYEQNKFDLNSLEFRDLSKPMGALNKVRLEHLKEKRENSYFYKVCYSNQYLVNNCLAGIEPFKRIENSDIPEDCNQLLTSIKNSFETSTTSPNNFYELIPEFFFLPEFLKDVELPPWAEKSGLTFVYLHRKALESKKVSENLNNWIDLIWGYKQVGKDAVTAYNVFDPDLYEKVQNKKNSKKNFGQIPKQLFTSKHLKKEFVFKSKIQAYLKKPFLINFEGVHIETADVSFMKKDLTFKLISSDNKIYSYDFDFSIFKSDKFVAKSNNYVKINQSSNMPIILFKNIFIGDSKRICYIDNYNNNLHIINSQNAKIEHAIKMHTKIDSIMTSQDGWLAVSAIDASVTIFDVNRIRDKKLTILNNHIIQNADSINYISNSDSIPVHKYQNNYYGKISFSRELITCIAISQTFHTFVCGTNDNYLFYCRLNPNKMVVDKMVELDGKPNKIIVTDNWGFVVVFMIKKDKNTLSVFTINGDAVKSKDLDVNLRIVDMITVSSVPGGFDYIIVADSSRNISVYEAFDFRIEKEINISQGEIRKLVYIKELALLIVFCEEGNSHLIYLPITDF
ncbi:hypothetical protein M9Y10_035534 [Tritrichomonas musculus]|uniref:BEACH domain-containing protein n=1 Tax=Tritrichomonas musculus TaxID=1915356 RepID=A0ABR2KI52_9EUKA